jgi:hypothetical protein
MKKKINQITLLIFAIATMIVSCKKDDNSTPSTPATNTTTIITSGSWRVSFYHESNDDHTSNYNGYTFTFNSNGTMTATNSGGTTNGTWSNDDSQNEFHISIGSSSPLSDLSNGWLIISKTSTEIDLKDDNSSHNEELHFTKN